MTDLASSNPPQERRIARLLTLAAALVLVSIPLRVVAHGWLPKDDVRRHAAKAVSGKEWSEIVLLRPGAEGDLHAGWHAALGFVHRVFGAEPRELAGLAIVGLAALFLTAPLTRFRAPEAWLAALVAVALLEPTFYPRLFSGRPLVLAMAVLALVATSWEALAAERAPRGALVAFAALFALVTWMHGSWYLWLLPIGCFFLAGERRAGARLAAAFAAGVGLGALATGRPFASLRGAVDVLLWSFGEHDLDSQLATEFQPGQGAAALVLAVAVLLVWRGRELARPRFADPVFLIALLGWLAGLAVSRFWSDWGLPALVVWVARELESAFMPFASSIRKRALAAGLGAAALFLAVTGNRGNRWATAEGSRHLRHSDPIHAAWLPAEGGILYSNSMGLFYDTFFENPRAGFRYAVGFEPGLMPEADLAIFRRIQLAGGDDASLLPWARKLRPIDRLAVARPGGPEPEIPGLDWYQPFAGLWLGRPVVASSSPGS